MRRFAVIVHLAVLLTCCSCAVFNRDNTPALNYVEDHMLPEEAPAKYFVMPFVLPVGLVAITVDAVIIHPVSVADDALADTQDVLWDWDDSQWIDHYVTECAKLVPRTVFTPIFLPGAFLARSMFHIEPHGGNVRLRERTHHPEPDMSAEENQRAKKAADLVAAMKSALDGGRLDEAMSLADEGMKSDMVWVPPACRAVKAAVLLERGEVDAFCRYSDTLLHEEVITRFVKRLSVANPVEQVKLLALLRGHEYRNTTDAGKAALTGAFESLVGSKDRAVVMRALEVFCSWPGRNDPRIRAIVERVAKGDDPVLAAAAQGYLDNWQAPY